MSVPDWLLSISMNPLICRPRETNTRRVEVEEAPVRCKKRMGSGGAKNACLSVCCLTLPHLPDLLLVLLLRLMPLPPLPLQVGDFASAIDEVFETVDEVTVEAFLVVIMHWMGIDEMGDDLRKTIGDICGPLLAEEGSEEASVHSTEKDLLEEEDSFDGEQDSLVGDGAITPAFGALSSPGFKGSVAVASPRSLQDIQAQYKQSLLEGTKAPKLHAPPRWWWWWWRKLKLKADEFFLRRRFRRQLEGASLPPWEEVVEKFQKLDIEKHGGLSPDMMELLLSWAFDIDLQPHEWCVLAEVLDGERTGEAKMAPQCRLEREGNEGPNPSRVRRPD